MTGVVTNDSKFACAKWIVSPNLSDGATHTTIAAALADASSGDDIFIKPGTYTENLTGKAGVSLIGFPGDSEGRVEIVGKISYSASGLFILSNLLLTTDGDFAIEVTGSNDSDIKFYRCNLNGADNTIISFTSSNSASQLTFFDCWGNLLTTGIAYYASTSPGNLVFIGCGLENNGGSTTVSNNSAGFAVFRNCRWVGRVSTSSTGGIQGEYSYWFLNTIGGPAVAHNGSGSNCQFTNCDFAAGAQTAITIGASASLVISGGSVASSNTASISGAGSVSYGGITFTSAGNITVTTQTPLIEGPNRIIGGAATGVTNTLSIQNTSNTASSEAEVETRVGGTSAGDAYFQCNVTGTQAWTFGVDNSDADAFALSANTALGTTNVMRSSIAGEINYPLQPAFLAVLGTSALNVTGAGTTYTVGTDALTEIYDQNNDFTTAGVFTAPVTGRYFLQVYCGFDGVTTAMTNFIGRIVTGNRTYHFNTYNVLPVGTSWYMSGCTCADMDALDTAVFNFTISGGAGDTADLLGTTGSTERCYVSGYLIA